MDFDAHGMKCHITKGPMGHWCGYVGIPQTHPWHGKDYDSEVRVPDEVRDRPIDVDKVGAINLFCAAGKSESVAEGIVPMVLAIDVHGGLTYARDHAPNQKPDGLWWLGFDCAHAGDACTPQEADERNIYRDESYVKGECDALAKQLSQFTQ